MARLPISAQSTKNRNFSSSTVIGTCNSTVSEKRTDRKQQDMIK